MTNAGFLVRPHLSHGSPEPAPVLAFRADVKKARATSGLFELVVRGRIEVALFASLRLCAVGLSCFTSERWQWPDWFLRATHSWRTASGWCAWHSRAGRCV